MISVRPASRSHAAPASDATAGPPGAGGWIAGRSPRRRPGPFRRHCFCRVDRIRGAESSWRAISRAGSRRRKAAPSASACGTSSTASSTRTARCVICGHGSADGRLNAVPREWRATTGGNRFAARLPPGMPLRAQERAQGASRPAKGQAGLPGRVPFKSHQRPAGALRPVFRRFWVRRVCASLPRRASIRPPSYEAFSPSRGDGGRPPSSRVGGGARFGCASAAGRFRPRAPGPGFKRVRLRS